MNKNNDFFDQFKIDFGFSQNEPAKLPIPEQFIRQIEICPEFKERINHMNSFMIEAVFNLCEMLSNISLIESINSIYHEDK